MIKCSGADGKCMATFESDTPFSPNAKYTCRVHTRPNEDKERFQKHQFDRDLNRAGTPIGTTHIPGRQGAPRSAGSCPNNALENEEEEEDA